MSIRQLVNKYEEAIKPATLLYSEMSTKVKFISCINKKI